MSGSTRHASRLAVAVLTLAGTSAPLHAQDGTHRIPRRILSAAIGAGLGLGLSSITRSGGGGMGACSSSKCVTLTSTLAGGAIGFLIGSEQDRLNSLRYRGGRPFALRLTSTNLRGEAVALSATDTLVGVGGTAGAELFRSGPGELRAAGVRGATLRGISTVSLSPTGTLAVGTVGGAYLYPSGGGPGALVLEQEVGASISAAGRAFVATGSRIVSVPDAADSVGAWPSFDVGSPVHGFAYDPARSLLWAGTDSGIVALSVRGGSARTGASVRRLSSYERRLAVALGDSGVRVFDVAEPAAPRLASAWTGERFSYDVSLIGGRLYVASGLDGVTVLDASGSSIRVLGLARDVGFAVALASRGGYTYVLDRSRNALRRFDSTSPTP
jgi:hypothetical protein